MKESSKKNELVFSGIQPSASQVHLGNYLGAMRNFISLSKEKRTIFCIVDFHALTRVSDPKILEENTLSLAAAYLSIGLDPEQSILFRQSDVAEVAELTWYLSCVFPLGLLERAHALKDAKAKSKTVNSGLMFYPILMASDILLYQATHVPVGADQKQHIEMARDVAERFNSNYKPTFTIPEPLIDNATGVIPGLDGQKMSKSYDNYIGLFESSKVIRKKIMRITTDSKSVEDKKDPKTCNIFKLYSFFASKDELTIMKDKYLSGGYGYGEAKQVLYEAVEREISPIREKYNLWIEKSDELKDMLKFGALKAREIALPTIDSVREAVGVGKRL